MKLSASQSVLGADLPEVFAVAKERGFDAVELDWRELEQIHGGTLSPEDCPRWLQAAQENGVAISGVAAHFLGAGGIESPDAARRERALWEIREGLQLCRDLRAETLRLPFSDVLQNDEKQHLLESLKILTPEAYAAGVIIHAGHALSADEAAPELDGVKSSQDKPHIYSREMPSAEALNALKASGHTGYVTVIGEE